MNKLVQIRLHKGARYVNDSHITTLQRSNDGGKDTASVAIVGEVASSLSV